MSSAEKTWVEKKGSYYWIILKFRAKPLLLEVVHPTSFVLQYHNAALIDAEHIVNNVFAFHMCWV